jgi:uncharacterized protein (DUF342 family)
MMQENVIYSSEFISILRMNDGFYIQSFRKGMTLEQFNRIIIGHPEIKVTSIMAVRNALVNAPRSPELFAEIKERISVELSDDELRAYVTLCLTDEELSGSNRADLFKEILRRLKDMGVTYGIKNNIILGKMANNTPVLVAEGNWPVNGDDSRIRMYELKEAKPEVKEDGNVDHYELNLINRVAVGDWLGEKTDPTEGFPGKTVKGSILMPVPGKDLPLFYDRNTVREVYREGLTTLFSMANGAVHYDGEKIGVSNHLEIKGNIDFKTGNIDFDGFLTVKGTVEDSFSVAASKDIEILGDYGIGGVKDINSNGGSIFIKGGIAGNNKAVIRSKKNIYTKFVADATIICDGSLHIGFYCLNSNIKAKEVILDSPKGQIIGGNIEAEIRVIASTIGSASEKRTVITVTGFDRRQLKQSLENTIEAVEALKVKLSKAKMEVSVYGNASGLSKEQKMVYERIRYEYFEIKDQVKQLEEERKALSGYLRTHGEGEISILKKVYPNTLLEIKKVVREVTAPIMCVSYYVQDGQIKEL